MANVRFDGIRKSCGPTPVLRDVSLSKVDGAFPTLVDPSGCGKSMLLRSIAGLDVQDGGSGSIGGRVVDALRPKRRDIRCGDAATLGA